MSRQLAVSESEPKSSLKEAVKPPALQLPALPINTLDSSLARNYSQIHTLLVVSTFFARFQSLVSNTGTTLRHTLAVVGILQIVYVVLCLPPTSNSPTSSKPAAPKTASKQMRVGKSQKAAKAGKTEPGAAGATVPALLSHLLAIVLATPFFTVVLILFGAPFTTDLELTALCAAHMASLAVMPLVFVHGVDQHHWWEVVALLSPADEIFGASVGTLVGAWLGAVPIPLDWDREWQRWPITIVSGAYIGWAAGKVIGATVFKGKRLDLT